MGQLDGDMKVRGFASGIADQAVGRNGLRSDYLGGYATWRGSEGLAGLYVDGVLQAFCGQRSVPSPSQGQVKPRGETGLSVLNSACSRRALGGDS